jgi:hypothetical protein
MGRVEECDKGRVWGRGEIRRFSFKLCLRESLLSYLLEDVSQIHY